MGCCPARHIAISAESPPEFQQVAPNGATWNMTDIGECTGRFLTYLAYLQALDARLISPTCMSDRDMVIRKENEARKPLVPVVLLCAVAAFIAADQNLMAPNLSQVRCPKNVLGGAVGNSEHESKNKIQTQSFDQFHSNRGWHSRLRRSLA